MSEQSEQSNVIKFAELKFPVIEYGVTEAQIAEVAERYKDPDASTDEGYEHCKEGCKVLRAMRTAVETRRLDLKRPITEWVRVNVDVRGKELIRLIRVAEVKVRAEKERIDEIKQAEARQAAEAEQQRVDDIKANIEKIMATAREQNPNDTASDYSAHITWLTELMIDEEVFGEFVDEANTARDAALFKLTQWHQQAVKREADDVRRRNERAELDRKKKELDKIEAKQKKEADRIEKVKRETAERAAAATAEREKGEREAAQRKADLEKAEQEKIEREEREAAEKETARIDCIKGFIGVILESPTMYEGLLADAIDVIITQTQEKEPDAATFEEFLPDAIKAWQESIKTLETMAKDARSAEEKARREEEALLPDKEKLTRWCAAISAIHEPKVLNDKAQKILRRYGADLSKLVQRLQSDIGKL